MRQAVIVIGSFLLLSTLAGCATDPIDLVVEEVIKEMSNARAQLGSVSDKLEGSAKLAKEKNKKISKSDLKDIFTGEQAPSKSLRKVGDNMNKLFADANGIKAKVNEAKQQALKEKFKGRLESSFRDLGKEFDRLKRAEAEAKKLAADSDTVQYLEENMREALQEFEAVTRQK